MQRTFTRQELYDLVWTTPIVQLAEQLKISDRGLSKTCARHQIPVPGRGYWAKVESGQPTTKTPLWKIDNPSLNTVHIGGAKRSVNPYVAFAVEAAHKAVEDVKTKPPAPPKPSHTTTSVPPAKGAITFEPVKRPHTSISGLALELKGAEPDRDGEISAAGIRIHRNSRSRIVAFLHHLAIALEGRDIVIAQGERALVAQKSPDSVSFEITEAKRREKHEPTAAELKKKQEHDRRRQLASRGGEWISWESFWPEYDYAYSGNLTFEINNWADGARKKWSEGKHQTLESMLESIADGILYHLAFDKARREEREDAERRRQHMAHRRHLQKQRIEREKNRATFLNGLVEYQREAADLRATIAEATNCLDQASPEYLRMITWAQQRLAYLVEKNEMATLTANLREQNLFPETDDLFDPEGEPPPSKGYWDD
ncbi:hypothetical protein [Neorhizobium petrolearium]|uniref:hypothetical protein n=1 Tax=Neorhizobium petrolearium TaxID=515361 RepID=UPI003F18ECC1